MQGKSKIFGAISALVVVIVAVLYMAALVINNLQG